MYDKNVELDGELVMILDRIEDPRSARGVRYSFSHLLLICIYGVLAGYSEASEIAFYAKLNEEYFKEKLGIEKIPSHDTISRILAMVNFEELSANLNQWLEDNFHDLREKVMNLKVLHVDGKAVRAASKKQKGEKPKYVLNAMYEGESIGLKVQEIGEKENEISRLPDYLKQFNLKDTIVTIDAIGCNKTVINSIIDGGGSFVIPVKDNQKNLHKCIKKEIERLNTTDKFTELKSVKILSNEHGRIETMKCSLIENTEFVFEELGLKSFYGHIAKIGVFDKKVITLKDGEETVTNTRSIFITNMEEITADVFMKIKKAHWNIEMQHWLLDVQLYEDKMTANKGNSMLNASILRRFCMQMKKQDVEYAGKPMKRFLMANAHDINRIEKILLEKC
ncbi:MAG: ISAs1 family transposase [Eubacteriales bacterium]